MQEAEQKLARSPAFLQAVLGAFFAASIVLLFSVDLQFRYQDAIAQGKKTALNFAKILAEHTVLTFEGVEQTLREAEKIRQDGLSGRYAKPEDMNAALRLLQQTSPVVVAVGWTDASGEVLAHSYDHKPPRTNISGMPHFNVQRDSPNNRLYVAPPYRSAANDRWFTAASLRLNNAEGTFAGILTAPLDQSYFIKIYRSIDLGNNGSILLLHRDGQLLAREPSLDSAIGKSFAGGPLLTEYLPKSETGSYETVSVVDGVPRVAGYTAIRGLPLVLLVSYARARDKAVLASGQPRFKFEVALGASAHGSRARPQGRVIHEFGRRKGVSADTHAGIRKLWRAHDSRESLSGGQRNSVGIGARGGQISSVRASDRATGGGECEQCNNRGGGPES